MAVGAAQALKDGLAAFRNDQQTARRLRERRERHEDLEEALDQHAAVHAEDAAVGDELLDAPEFLTATRPSSGWRMVPRRTMRIVNGMLLCVCGPVYMALCT